MGFLGLQSPGFRLAPLREHGSRGGRGLEIEDLGCEGEQRMHPMAAIMCATSEAWIRNQTQPWVWDIPTIPALSSFGSLEEPQLQPCDEANQIWSALGEPHLCLCITREGAPVLVG